MTEPRIVSDPKVMMGKPVVARTRIGVDLILEKLGSGEPIEAVLESHPLCPLMTFWRPFGTPLRFCGQRSSIPSTPDSP